MVHETMPVIETASASPFMFARLKKFSTPTEQPMNRIATASHRREFVMPGLGPVAAQL